MSHSLGSLALILLVAMVLFAYSAGFSEGKSEGSDEGHARGKKEGAVRAFAVGYDRGKRERNDDEDDDDEQSSPTGDGASIVVFLVLALGTFAILLVVQSMRQQGG